MDPTVVRRHLVDETKVHAANGPGEVHSPEANKNINTALPHPDRGALSSEPISSSSPTSPRTGTSPRIPNELDAYTLDSEPVPFSSTPDLGSRTMSSSPDRDYDSQLVITPPEEKFIRTLDRKLKALVNANNRVNLSSPASLYCDRPQAKAPKTTSLATSTVEYGSTSSSVTPTDSQLCLKRKRTEPPTCDTSVEDAGVAVDEDSDTEVEESSVRLDVPVSKKLKETSFNYSVTESASIRRARSLSASSSQASLVSTDKASPSSTPLTPVYKPPGVPIIAPPEFDAIPRPSLSPDDAAEARLRLLLRREKTFRRREGFEKGINDIFDNSITKEQVDDLLGIDEDFRKEVVAWMLRITPSKKLGVGELRHQLRTCPETRFHAILLFTRYFMRVGDAMPVATERETPLMKLGRKRITWDVAMSCLSLAVKFNRDFLNPFSPVYAREFLVLAPHPMSHDDFEISQKDVLQALNYEIRETTPGPFMQEIWHSLPSLRRLLSFPDGWELTQLNAWQILNASVTASEMLQFPVSLLTAAAIIEGAVVALMDVYERDTDAPEADTTAREDAEATIADVVMDIKELMDIPSVDMKRCRRWLQKIIRATY